MDDFAPAINFVVRDHDAFMKSPGITLDMRECYFLKLLIVNCAARTKTDWSLSGSARKIF